MIELSVVRDLVAIFGVIAGFSYYVLTVRNAQRSQRIAEESREVQLFSSYWTEEDFKRMINLLNMEWTDYDDFERKYGSDNNPDNYAKRNAMLMIFNNIGYLIKRGLVDRKPYFDLMGTTPYIFWVKFGDVIYEIRRRYNQPWFGQFFEYYANECVKYWQKKGYDTTVPENFFTYVPDE